MTYKKQKYEYRNTDQVVGYRIEENRKNREEYTGVPLSFLVAIDGNDEENFVCYGQCVSF